MLEEQLSRLGDSKTCPVAVMMREGNVLTGKRNYTEATWKDISVWTIPGGRCDSGETLEETLRREVREEVGIDTFEILEFLGEANGAKEGDRVPLFLCKTDQEAKLMEPEKFSEWRWVTKEEYIADKEYAGFSPEAREIIIKRLGQY